MYASDLRSVNMQLEFRQKVYAGQLMRIETDKQRAVLETSDKDLILKNSSPRQKIVSRNSLKQIIGQVSEAKNNRHHKLSIETEQQAARKKENLRNVSTQWHVAKTWTKS